MRLKNTLLKNEWIDLAIREEIKKYMETNENENTTIQMFWDAVKAVQRGKYIAMRPSQETRKIPNTKSNSTPKGNRSRTAKIKIRAEINNIESKKNCRADQQNQELVF